MRQLLWKWTLAAGVLLLGVSSARADHLFWPRPTVTHYYPAPAVTYYTPAVSYYTPPVTYYAPRVSYYAPAVSYYAPRVSYYAPAMVTPGAAATTTTYGLFGRPKSTTTYYYQPVFVGP